MKNNKSLQRILKVILFVALYLVSTVPVGMTLYAVKEKLGWNVFKIAGFHHFMSCVGSETNAIMR